MSHAAGTEGRATAELALKLVGVASRRAEESDRIAELAHRGSFDELAELLEQLRVLPLAGARLCSLLPHEVPGSFAHRVEEAQSASRRHATLYSFATRETILLLEGAGIPTVPIKGAALAEAVYADMGMRSPSADVDLVVPASRFEEAVELLLGDGYLLDSDVAWWDRLPHYHCGFVPSDPSRPLVELHWRVHWYEREFAEQALARSVVHPEEGRRLQPADELATLLMIYARDGFLGLRLAADIGVWWDARAGELRPGCLDPILSEHPRLRQSLLAALTVAERTVGLPSAALVSEGWRLGRRARLATRLANWDAHGSPDEARTNITLVDLLLTPPGAGHVFLRHYYLQPLGEYTRTYGWNSEARARNHVRRLAHVAARLVKSMAKYAHRLAHLRGGREWAPLPAAGADS